MKHSRKQRLKTPAEFRYVFSRSKASKDDCFRVLGRENEQEVCRLGLAVSKKNCRKAVGRNRIKRVIRESFRQHSEVLAKGKGIDFVVLPTAKATTISNKMLASSLDKHWSKVQANPGRSAGLDNRKNLHG
jgi:ribonuclease P protein component